MGYPGYNLNLNQPLGQPNTQSTNHNNPIDNSLVNNLLNSNWINRQIGNANLRNSIN